MQILLRDKEESFLLIIEAHWIEWYYIAKS